MLAASSLSRTQLQRVLSFELFLSSQTRFRKFLVPEIKCKCSIHDERPLSSLIGKITISEKGPVTIQGIDKSYPDSKTTDFPISQTGQRHGQTWAANSFSSSKSAEKPKIKLLSPNLLPTPTILSPGLKYLTVVSLSSLPQRSYKSQPVFNQQTVAIPSAPTQILSLKCLD